MPKLIWQDGGQVLFRFDDIYLQDSVHNEPASHGFVSFAIQPRGGAREGDSITNAADIFFDFNAYMRTDSTKNFITQARTSVEGIVTARHFMAYPNPTNGSLTIQSNAAGDAAFFDMQGRALMRFKIVNGKTSIRLPAELPAGIYMLQGRTSGGESLGVLRIVVQ